MQMAHPSTGLASSEQGYTFDSAITTLPAGSSQEYSFRILKQGGKVQTAFVEDQTKLMHFYAIRADLTGYQHLHPEMGATVPGGPSSSRRSRGRTGCMPPSSPRTTRARSVLSS